MSRLEGYEVVDGIYSPAHRGGTSEYAATWEREAAEDHVASAVARRAPDADYEALTAKLSRLWRAFPEEASFDSVLEVGCGYGRIPLFLSREKRTRCRVYYGVDVSRRMLEHFRGYRERYGVFQDADVRLIQASADRLPVADDSVDFVTSTATFLHMGKRYVEAALRELARVLRPGGVFLFDASFPNALCPANVPYRMRGGVPLGRKPHQLKYYTLAELKQLVAASGLESKAGGWVVEANSFSVLPKRLGPLPVPFARAANAAVRAPRPGLRRVLATTFSAFSPTLVAPDPAFVVAR